MISMNDKACMKSAFIDSNIWLYALIEDQQENDKAKHPLAKQLLSEYSNIHISTQVVNEVCINLMRKANKDNDYILKFTQNFLASYTVHKQTTDDLLSAATLRLDYHFSYWDSLIVASAINNKCEILFSVDMQNGLKVYDNLVIKNPLL